MRRSMATWIPLVTCLLLTAGVWADSRIDSLLAKLAGTDEVARCEARQMLPREGVEVVAKLLPLVKHENPVIWYAAFGVLSDFANEVSVAGREADRAAVATSLMSLVAPDQPPVIKERGLRLLWQVVPKGFDITPIAALLNDKDLREKARSTLVLIQTPEAAAALREALKKADPDFAAALLEGLRELKDGASLAVIRDMARHESPKIRAAAVRALSWAADPADVPVALGVAKSAEDATRSDATDALLLLADAIIAKGTDRPAALAAYREVLASSTNTALQGAAIVGLGTCGCEAAVKAILGTMGGKDARDLEPAALAAFELIRSPAGYQALIEACATASPDMQISLLGVFGRKRDTVFIPLLSEKSQAGEARVRHAALGALAESGLAEGMPALIAAAEKTSGADKTLAVTSLRTLSDALRRQGSPQAGKAFNALYRLSQTDDQRRQAMEGIKTFPTPEAFELIRGAMTNPQLIESASASLAGVARVLLDAGRTGEANEALQLLIDKAASPEAIQKLIQMSGAIANRTDLPRRLGFVTSWTMVGPFPWSASEAFKKININEPQVDPTSTYKVGDKELRWKAVKTQDLAGVVDLTGAFGVQAGCVAYGVAEITVPAACEAVARMGSDDGIKLWVNGQVAHENNVDRGLQLDQDKAKVQLKAGKNTLLVEVTQGGGGWNFCLRLTQSDGAPLAFTAP